MQFKITLLVLTLAVAMAAPTGNSGSKEATTAQQETPHNKGNNGGENTATPEETALEKGRVGEMVAQFNGKPQEQQEQPGKLQNAEEKKADDNEHIVVTASVPKKMTTESDENQGIKMNVALETKAPNTSAADEVETKAPNTSAADVVETKVPNTSAADEVETEAPNTSAADEAETEAEESTASREFKPEAPNPSAVDEVKPEAPNPSAAEEIKSEAGEPTASREFKPEAPNPSAVDEVKPEAPNPSDAEEVKSEAGEPTASREFKPEAPNPSAAEEIKSEAGEPTASREFDPEARAGAGESDNEDEDEHEAPESEDSDDEDYERDQERYHDDSDLGANPTQNRAEAILADTKPALLENPGSEDVDQSPEPMSSCCQQPAKSGRPRLWPLYAAAASIGLLTMATAAGIDSLPEAAPVTVTRRVAASGPVLTVRPVVPVTPVRSRIPVQSRRVRIN